MKSGASDPFTDDEETEEPDEATTDEQAVEGKAASEPGHDDGREQERAETTEQEGSSDRPDQETTQQASEPDERPDASTPDRSTSTDAEAALDALEDVADESEDDDGLSRDQLPFVLRRDKVKDERPEVHQLFVQRETHEDAVDAERDLQDRLEDDLSRTDAREAIYLAGMTRLDEAESILREWGYDL